MDKVDPSAVSLLNSALIGQTASKEARKSSPQDTKKTKTRGETRNTLFSEFLEKSVADLGPLKELAPSEEALTELMDAVHSAGSDLRDRPFADEILRYKKAVRNFLHYVVENGYDVQEVQGIKKKIVVRGEAKWKDIVYHQVRVIDQKLEELAAAILSGQTTQLERVSKLDEITGMLVDLTVSGVIRERDE